MNRRGFLLGLGASALVLPRAPTSYFFAPRAGWLHEAPFGTFTGGRFFATPGVRLLDHELDEDVIWQAVEAGSMDKLIVEVDPSDPTKATITMPPRPGSVVIRTWVSNSYRTFDVDPALLAELNG